MALGDGDPMNNNESSDFTTVVNRWGSFVCLLDELFVRKCPVNETSSAYEVNA